MPAIAQMTFPAPRLVAAEAHSEACTRNDGTPAVQSFSLGNDGVRFAASQPAVPSFSSDLTTGVSSFLVGEASRFTSLRNPSEAGGIACTSAAPGASPGDDSSARCDHARIRCDDSRVCWSLPRVPVDHRAAPFSPDGHTRGSSTGAREWSPDTLESSQRTLPSSPDTLRSSPGIRGWFTGARGSSTGGVLSPKCAPQGRTAFASRLRNLPSQHQTHHDKSVVTP